MAQFSEEAVHDYLFKTGLTDLIDETAALDERPVGDELEVGITIGARADAPAELLDRAVEEALAYRLVRALEAVRIRGMSLGWSPETVAGGGAAAVETGVPQFMVSMLIRAGLPSRRAAMAAIEDAKPVFVTPAEMRASLESD